MIDHLVLVVPSLADACAALIEDWGAAVNAGGAHPRHGTHNALLRVGRRCYLEILAADPVVPKAQRSERGQRVAAISTPTLMEVIFAIPPPTDGFLHDLPDNIKIESDTPGQRLRPDGHEVRWRLLRLRDANVGILPDMIEWLSPHPSLDLTEGAELQSLVLYHPNAGKLSESLSQVGRRDPMLKILPGQGLAADIMLPKGVWSLTGA